VLAGWRCRSGGRAYRYARDLQGATGVDQNVLEDVIDTYVDWREQSRGVWLAYGRWSQAPPEDATLRFAAYLAELDREHRACDVYEEAIVRTTARLSAQA
jgi:hypothetical protein